MAVTTTRRLDRSVSVGAAYSARIREDPSDSAVRRGIALVSLTLHYLASPLAFVRRHSPEAHGKKKGHAWEKDGGASARNERQRARRKLTV
jgi:hypothetical protein